MLGVFTHLQCTEMCLLMAHDRSAYADCLCIPCASRQPCIHYRPSPMLVALYQWTDHCHVEA